MKIEFSPTKPLNDKEQAFVDSCCYEMMKESQYDIRKYTQLKESITCSYQVFITPDSNQHIDDIASLLNLSFLSGTKKPCRTVVINQTVIGLQVFDELQNESLIRDAIKHTFDHIEKELEPYE